MHDKLILPDMTFESRSKKVGFLDVSFNDTDIKNEPMFFSADVEFCMKHGGPITKNFLENIPREFIMNETAIIDTRSHMLMHGWYPCIPGWHHDDVARNTPDGQPNYDEKTIPYRTKHVVALVNANVAPTEFLEGTITLSDPDMRKNFYSNSLSTDIRGKPQVAVYKMWDDEINYSVSENAFPRKNMNPTFTTFKVEDRAIYEFDDRTFHRGTAAVAKGWRWFGRVTIGRKAQIQPEIRNQVNVYLPVVNQGW